MAEEYSKGQLWKIYEKLPEELKEAIFSEKTAESIWDIAERNEIDEVPKLARIVGRVLMGLLDPRDLEEKIRIEFNLDREKAKKINREIEMFIFHPVRVYLERLYRPEIAEKKEEVIKREEVPERKAPPSQKFDIYREPIEEEKKEG